MLKISDDTIEIIADNIVDLIKLGRLLKRDAEGGDGWQSKENLEVLWHDYIKRVDPHEKKYIVIINSMLTKQAKEVFDKIKRYPNNYKKWMFDRKKWLREFAEAEAKFITKLIKQEGQKAIDLALKLSRKSYYKAEEIPITIAFDVYNPEVTEELLKQTTRFPAGVVGTSEEIIRREIANGLELGESIDKLRKRVTERLGPTYIKNRAEMIARSETIYASNAGSELGYMQSGVVEGKKWLTALDERTCFPCTDMNNMTAPLGQPTWEKEGLNIGEVQGKYGLDFDYTEGAMPHPPLHPRCRCTIIPIVERVEAFKPAETIKEAEDYIQNKLNLDYAHYEGIKLDYANTINEALIDLKRKYPDIFLGRIVSKDMGIPSLKGIMSHGSYIDPHKAGMTRGTLYLNLRYFDKFPLSYNFNKEIMRMFKEGWMTPKKLSDLVVHEMGHNLTFAVRRFNSSAQLNNYYRKLKIKPVLKGISKYAESNFLESLAEAFVKYNRGDKISPEAFKALQQYLGVGVK